MKKHWLLILVLLAAACQSKQEESKPEKKAIAFDTKSIFDFAAAQYSKAVVTFRDSTRMGFSSNADGTWVTETTSGWMAGFFPGILWYIHEYSGDTTFAAEARTYTARMEQEQFMDRHHDIGFMMFSSYGNGYRLTGDTTYRPILIQSAYTALKRFNPKTGTIKSWNFQPNEHPTIIDNMMNLELLLWAFRETQDSVFLQIATTHANTTIANQFRPNNSTFHVVTYDSTTGQVMHKKTAQGYSDDSMWARGQAWGIYGFTMMYRYTQDAKYLEMAQKSADLFISRLPEDGVPFWDFDSPDIPNTHRDASAGAIASCAFLELSAYAANEADQLRYYNTAINTLNTLSTDAYLAKQGNYQGVLLHSCYNANKNFMVDVHKTYADYYYLEALLRLEAMMEQAM